MFGQLFFERRHNRNRVKDSIDGDLRRAFNTRQNLLFFEGNTKLIIDLKDVRIDFVERVQLLFLHRRRVIIHVLKINFRIIHHRPFGLFESEPTAISFEPPIKEPLRFVLFCRDKADNIFVQSLRRELLFNIAIKSIFIFIRLKRAHTFNGAILDGVFGNFNFF